MRKKHYITRNRNDWRSECMCRLGIQNSGLFCTNKDRALSGSKEGVNI